MRLRKLELKDAPYMLEWMHDASVVEFLQGRFMEKTIDDCVTFINVSQDSCSDCHLAIVDEKDEYMGTVSLKHISKNKEYAEFAIVVRRKAMGKGYSLFGMNEILKLGIHKLGLSRIFWCVNPNNKRAVGFYHKNKHRKTINIPEILLNEYSDEMQKSLLWFVYEDIERKDIVNDW